MKNIDLKVAHKHSSDQKEIYDSRMCGCFHCLLVFDPDDVKTGKLFSNESLSHKFIGRTTEYRREDWEVLGLCPSCGIDSVLGDLSGLPVSNLEFLEKMQEHYFGDYFRILEKSSENNSRDSQDKTV